MRARDSLRGDSAMRKVPLYSSSTRSRSGSAPASTSSGATSPAGGTRSAASHDLDSGLADAQGKRSAQTIPGSGAEQANRLRDDAERRRVLRTELKDTG